MRDQLLKRHRMDDSASPGSQGAKKRRIEGSTTPDLRSHPVTGSPTPRASRRVPARPESISSFNSETTSSSAGGPLTTPSKSTRAKRVAIQTMDQLELAEPSVVFELAWPVPHSIRILQDILASSNSRAAFVPKLPALQQILSVQALSDVLISASDPTPADHEFFRHALSIWRQAADVNDTRLDEQNWYPVVRAILNWPLPDPFDAHPSPALVRVVESQNMLFHRNFLPKKPRPSSKQPIEVATAVSGVKVDHLLTFNNTHPALRSHHEDLRRTAYAHELFTPPPCSPLANDIVKNWFVGMVVEVKAGDQTSLKAESQLALAAPAVLEATKRFSVGCSCTQVCECQDWDPATQPPVVGLLVDKHKWEMRIAYWDGKKKIRITQPASAGDTSSFEGVCRLLLLMRSLKDWAEEMVVPFLVSQLQARTRALANEGSGGEGSELEGGDD
ncbi:hypothetical protein FGG08_002489 [Glutinoglossum americanum]|uniref:PD-(D/E)XK nuclease-like domain-containing protein n=1 Tax=Glutinoglossum americanum TaxID=1670608 RepID=A0A9P8I951_9PEZI|nr:hypothetical protein FGG08_002489 [Glutinoglossum americanum]